MLRILYGGTFDPIHEGHLAVARAARDATAAKVYFLPAADPPHRPRPGASAEQRVRMIALAIAGEGAFLIDRRELDRSGPSWTDGTLREIRAQIGEDAPIAWLIGDDAFRELHTWHDWRSLFGLAHFMVAVRPGYDARRPGRAPGGRLRGSLDRPRSPRWRSNRPACCTGWCWTRTRPRPAASAGPWAAAAAIVAGCRPWSRSTSGAKAFTRRAYNPARPIAPASPRPRLRSALRPYETSL